MTSERDHCYPLSPDECPEAGSESDRLREHARALELFRFKHSAPTPGILRNPLGRSVLRLRKSHS